MAHLKGQHVNLLLKRGSSYGVIASSTNCSLDITANTADAAAKDDPGNGMFDNSEFTNYSWSASNESFIVDINYLAYLLDLVINGNGEVDMQFGNDANYYGNKFAKQGRAIISSLTVDAANGDFAKLSLSLDGNGERVVADEWERPGLVVSHWRQDWVQFVVEVAADILFLVLAQLIHVQDADVLPPQQRQQRTGVG